MCQGSLSSYKGNGWKRNEASSRGKAKTTPCNVGQLRQTGLHQPRSLPHSVPTQTVSIDTTSKPRGQPEFIQSRQGASLCMEILKRYQTLTLLGSYLAEMWLTYQEPTLCRLQAVTTEAHEPYSLCCTIGEAIRSLHTTTEWSPLSTTRGKPTQ